VDEWRPLPAPSSSSLLSALLNDMLAKLPRLVPLCSGAS
jgi:hypothetical protein